MCATARYYGIHRQPDGGEYVLAAWQREMREYDPMPQIRRILLELMKIGYRYLKGEDIGLAVLDFCSRYGFLGLKSAAVQKSYEDGSVKLYPWNPMEQRAMTAEGWRDAFCPFSEIAQGQSKLKWQEWMRAPEQAELADRELNYSYGEKTAWYGICGARYYRLLLENQRGEAFSLTPGNAWMTYETQEGQTRRRWRFDSLLSALNVGFGEMLLDPERPIHICRRCLRPYWSADARSRFCTPNCRNAWNVKQSRVRKRERQARWTGERNCP